MTTSVLTSTSIATLTITETPTIGQMQEWWEAMQQDPTRHIVYTDFMPGEFEAFLAPVRQGNIHMWIFLVGEDVGGAFYLHDGGTDDTGEAYAWLGTYILPPYRGRVAARAWQLTRQACEREGLPRIFAAIRVQNRPAQCFITRQMGFTRLGVYTDWSYFEGRLDHVVLYTLRRQDRSLAWVLAEQRARQFRRLAPPAPAEHRQGLQDELAAIAPTPRALTSRQKPTIHIR